MKPILLILNKSKKLVISKTILFNIKIIYIISNILFIELFNIIFACVIKIYSKPISMLL